MSLFKEAGDDEAVAGLPILMQEMQQRIGAAKMNVFFAEYHELVALVKEATAIMQQVRPGDNLAFDLEVVSEVATYHASAPRRIVALTQKASGKTVGFFDESDFKGRLAQFRAAPDIDPWGTECALKTRYLPMIDKLGRQIFEAQGEPDTYVVTTHQQYRHTMDLEDYDEREAGVRPGDIVKGKLFNLLLRANWLRVPGSFRVADLSGVVREIQGKRPTVGDMVKIKQPRAGHFDAKRHAGTTGKIVSDDQGSQPFKIEGAPTWFFEDELVLVEIL